MDSIDTLADVLSDEVSLDRSEKKLFRYFLDENDNEFMRLTLVGDYTMDFDHIKKNICNLISNNGDHSETDDVTKAFLAIVDAIIENDDQSIVIFCCECLLRWPNLSCLPLKLKFDVVQAIFDQPDIIAQVALLQLFIHCDEFKLEFLSRLNEFLDHDVYLTIGLLRDIGRNNQLYTRMYTKIISVLYDYLWNLTDDNMREVVANYISSHSMHLHIDSNSIMINLKSDEKRGTMLKFLDGLVSQNSDMAIEWIKLLLEIGEPDCIREAAKLTIPIFNFHVTNYFPKYISRLVELAPKHTNEVLNAFDSLDIDHSTVLKLSQRIIPSYITLSLLLKLNTDQSDYVDICLGGEHVKETLMVINRQFYCYKFAPRIISFVGRYDEANSIIYKSLQSEANKDSILDYADVIIRNCIDRIDMKYSLEIIEALYLVANVTEYATKLWLALTKLEPSYRRTVLMIRLCIFDEIKLEAINYFVEWLPYFAGIIEISSHILDFLPRRMFVEVVMHITECEVSVPLYQLLLCANAKKCDRILADYCVNLGKFDDLWLVADVLESQYAQILAWKHAVKPKDGVMSMHEMIQRDILNVPSDEIADRFITTALKDFSYYRDSLSYLSSIFAFLYNNTNVPFHIGLLGKVIVNGSNIDDLVNFFYTLVILLEPRSEKRDLLPILVYLVLSCSEGYRKGAIKAIKLIEDNEETKVLCENIENYKPHSNWLFYNYNF